MTLKTYAQQACRICLIVMVNWITPCPYATCIAFVAMMHAKSTLHNLRCASQSMLTIVEYSNMHMIEIT